MMIQKLYDRAIYEAHTLNFEVKCRAPMALKKLVPFLIYEILQMFFGQKRMIFFGTEIWTEIINTICIVLLCAPRCTSTLHQLSKRI